MAWLGNGVHFTESQGTPSIPFSAPLIYLLLLRFGLPLVQLLLRQGALHLVAPNHHARLAPVTYRKMDRGEGGSAPMEETQ